MFAHEVRERARLSSPKCAVVLFGHLSEGNVHVNVLGVEPGDEGIDDVVLRLVAEMGGNVAAEHGVGRAKVAWLHLSRTPEEIRTMRALKFARRPGRDSQPRRDAALTVVARESRGTDHVAEHAESGDLKLDDVATLQPETIF